MAISKNKAQRALSLLAKTAAQRDNEIEIFCNLSRPVESEDNEYNDSPILNSFQSVEGSSAILRMTNFTTREFYKRFNKFENKIETNRNTGSVRKTSHTPKNVLFMTLGVLKHDCK